MTSPGIWTCTMMWRQPRRLTRWWCLAMPPATPSPMQGLASGARPHTSAALLTCGLRDLHSRAGGAVTHVQTLLWCWAQHQGASAQLGRVVSMFEGSRGKPNAEAASLDGLQHLHQPMFPELKVKLTMPVMRLPFTNVRAIVMSQCCCGNRAAWSKGRGNEHSCAADPAPATGGSPTVRCSYPT